MVELVVASPYISSNDPITLFYVKDQLLALLPCRFDVLRWTGDGWENLLRNSMNYFGFLSIVLFVTFRSDARETNLLMIKKV
jgi:hypothetical protein